MDVNRPNESQHLLSSDITDKYQKPIQIDIKYGVKKKKRYLCGVLGSPRYT